MFLDGDDERAAELAIAEASDILELELEREDHAPIVIEFVQSIGIVAGRHFKFGPCKNFVRTDYSGVTLAHELGHTLGLEHEDGPENVMARRSGSDNIYLEHWQSERLQRGINRLAACP